MLYDRDYNQGPTDEEKQAYKDITGFDFGREREGGCYCRAVSPSSYPKAVRLYMTIFPNNYLDFVDLKDCDTLQKKNNLFLELLNKKDINEICGKKEGKNSNIWYSYGLLADDRYRGCHWCEYL